MSMSSRQRAEVHFVEVGAILDGRAEHGGIEPMVHLLRVLDGRVDGALIGDIDSPYVDPAPCLRIDVMQQSGVVPVERDHDGAFTRTVARQRSADAAACAADEDHGIVETVGDRDCHAGTAWRLDAPSAARYALCAAPGEIGRIAAI